MKFNTFLLYCKQNNNFPHALLVEAKGCNDYNLLIKNYLKSILCEKKLYCNECKICKIINSNSYIDLIIIDCTQKQLLKTDIDLIQNTFSFGSTKKEYIKLYVIIDVENSTNIATNSLLKFLEEPPFNTYALFFCKNQNMVLPTIASRCQRIIITNENNSENELINYCFDSINQYQHYQEKYDLNVQLELIKKLINTNDSNTQNEFINQLNEIEYNHLANYISLIAYSLNIEKRINIMNLKQYLKLNINKILLANKILGILEK